MLHKIAIHQTRLKAPGLGLDARGVCLGAKGLVLLPSWERLVAFLAVYTREVALTQVLGSLKIQLVRSQLGAREVALTFDAISSDVLDLAADVSRLAGGFTFTGTSRHFVQYRDNAAPFGYDASELLSNNAELCLYHQSFSQAYDLERQLELRELVLRLEARPESHSGRVPEGAWVLAAPALGPPLVRHLARLGVAAKVASIEAGSNLRGERLAAEWLFQLPSVPHRVQGLLTHTPGLSFFADVAPGVAVRFGYAHPLSLAVCPVFRPDELVLFSGGSNRASVLEQLPVFADVKALLQPRLTELITEARRSVVVGAEPERVTTRLRLLPSPSSSRAVSAMRLCGNETNGLRRLAYLLGGEALASTELAVTEQGVFLMQPPGLPRVPLGELYCRLGERVFIPLGYELVPRVDPSLVLAKMGVKRDHVVFFHADGSCNVIPAQLFTPLSHALVEPHLWSELETVRFPDELEAQVPTLWLSPLGVRPLGRANRGS